MRLIAIALAVSAVPVTAWAQTAAPQALPAVEVIGTSPLPGQGIDRNLLPYGTQVIRRATLEQSQTDNVTDYLGRRLPGAQVNDIQGSPFQGDLTFRGFRASGLLGASQGLSVYLDGVRVNEPFGDVVNWDMIPEFSIDTVTLVPGANPAFGLNTLGGAISLTTASGRTAPGIRADVALGSFGRKRLDLSHGGSGDDGWHHYIGATAFDEKGWRDQSEGRLGTVLVKVGRQDGPLDLEASVLAGRSRLIGNGLVPLRSWDEDAGPSEAVDDIGARRRSAIYTFPDLTRNELLQAAFKARWTIDDDTEADALAYLRKSRRSTVNGDTADDIEDGRPFNASMNQTATRQSAYGLAASYSRNVDAHRLQAGMTVDASSTRFRQSEQAGTLTADRGVEPGNEASELSARVAGRALAVGVYGTDTVTLNDATHLTATLRANHARVRNQLDSADEDTGDIVSQPRETFRYNSLNPAIGLTHRLSPALTVFGNVARNTRAPTVIELGCADPDQPCRLPAGLQSDPYLKQVKSTTVEIGLRAQPAAGQRVTLSIFRTDNRDDIVFGSVSATSQLGYFRNVDRTRHEGLDAEWQGRIGPVSTQLSYSRLRATYQVDDTLRFGDRNVQVRPGTGMAGMPRHVVKIGADWAATPTIGVGTDVQWIASRGVLGNEDGRVGDDDARRADLSLPSYTVVNLHLSYKPDPTWEFFARVGNLFDRRYETYGALASSVFDPRGAYTGEERPALFVAPGTPRNVWVGVRARF